MKTNYTTAKLFRTVLFAIIALFSTSTMFAQTVETTIFSDDFGGDNLSGGVPATTYSIVKYRITLDEPVDPNTTTTAGQLRIPNRKATGASGVNSVVGSLTSFLSPFTAKISEINSDSVVWTFNMRQNYNSSLSGFNDVQRGVATILVADNTNLSLANGYAVVNGGESPAVRRYRLVKFTDGLYSNDKIVGLINGQTLVDNREYMSIKVVYMPATNTWKLYDRYDVGTFTDPTIGTFTYAGSIVDASHTGKEMISFGFTNNYTGNVDIITWTDNYSVKTYKTEISTSVEAYKNNSFYKATIVDGAIKIEAENAKATLYDSKGQILKSFHVSNSAKVDINKQGLFILKMESENGDTYAEKLILR